jgi:hypothetical protein
MKGANIKNATQGYRFAGNAWHEVSDAKRTPDTEMVMSAVSTQSIPSNNTNVRIRFRYLNKGGTEPVCMTQSRTFILFVDIRHNSSDGESVCRKAAAYIRQNKPQKYSHISTSSPNWIHDASTQATEDNKHQILLAAYDCTDNHKLRTGGLPKKSTYFRRVRKIAKSTINFVMSVRPSVRPSP